jgi:hypothetical protein
MDDLLVYIFGPVIVVFAVIAMIGIGVQKGCEMISGKPKIEEVQYIEIEQPLEQKSLSHRAGHKVKEVSKDFIKGFFSK